MGNTYYKTNINLASTKTMNIPITGYSCFWFNPVTKAWQKSTPTNSLFDSSYLSEFSDVEQGKQPTLIVGENSNTELNTTTLTFLTQSNTDNNSYLFSLR